MNYSFWLAGASTFALSFLLTGAFRQYALRSGLLDRPNARSSHTRPTPRGGGIAVALACILIWSSMLLAHVLDVRLFLALTLCGTAVAAVGYIDDRRTVNPWSRLVVHFAAAAGALLMIDVVPDPWFAGTAIFVDLMSAAAAAIGIVAFLNIFNFMDGIDGLAATEAGFISAASAVLLGILGYGTTLIVVWLVLGCACLAFAYWNWEPAKIFMGDVGSGFVGFVTAVLLLISSRSGFSVWTAVILSGVFLADAGVTLLRRMLARERWYSAHRTHAYQWLSRRWSSHSKVSLLYLAINVCFVFPVAFWSVTMPNLAPGLAVGSIAVLSLAAWRAGAGRAEQRGENGRGARADVKSGR